MSKIVFDLDNTLSDELGSSVRPGIFKHLQRLKKKNHELHIWTNSNRNRALEIINRLKFREFFATIVCREDYDPMNMGLPKDIRRLNAQFLIDDDPSEVNFTTSLKLTGILISPYRKGDNPSEKELKDIEKIVDRSHSILRNFLA